MTDRAASDRTARAFFDELWKKGDVWEFESSEFERRRYAHLLRLVGDRRWARALEIGCGAGSFTRRLAPLAGHVVALDVAASAVERARAEAGASPTVEYRVANIMELDLRAEEPWDLIVMSETIYYVGWLYSFFDVAWLAAELFRATRPEGRLLLANTHGGVDDALVLPWITRTYRDLFGNVGYRMEREEVFRGSKHGVDIEVLMSVFARPP